MLTRLYSTITSEVGLDEVMLVGSLILVTVALWPIAERVAGDGRSALLAPGLVLLWIALPARGAFVLHFGEKGRRSE